MKTAYLNAKTAREITLQKVLEGMGYTPHKTTQNEAWYLSPFRAERTPSFKVNTEINKWYDFGEQKGGNTLDFVIYKYGFSVKEALNYLSQYTSFSFQQPDIISSSDSPKILKTTSVQHSALIEYLESRNISEIVYSKFCEEVHYQNKGKNYFALGFRNSNGGYELRSKFFKGCIGNKYITFLGADTHEFDTGQLKSCLYVYEGYFDLLSHFQLGLGLFSNADIISLNSLVNVEQMIPLLNSYKQVNLCLDNDEAGNKATQKVLELSNNVVDARKEYAGFKDLNEYLILRYSK